MATAADAFVNDVMTVPANLAGLPALSLPVGTATVRVLAEAAAGEMEVEVPVGMQLLARPFDEATLLRVGAALEAAAAFQLPDRVLRW
jgi:aspartyl-tRNA(Asn)/glutamyl-tRNA(Gln) amidotransferase subunit A